MHCSLVACCQMAVHPSCWIIHILWRRGADKVRAYKAKLIKVAVLKVCLCLIQEERKERSVVIPFFPPCLYHSSPCLPPPLSSLIPLYPRLSQENYNLTAHFNISASKWVWQAILCVTSPFLCPYLYPSTHSSLSPPQPPCVVCLSLPSTGSTFSMWQERERGRWGDREKNKNKSGSKQELSARLSGCLSLSPGEFHDTYTTMNLQWGEVSLHPHARHSCSDLDSHRRCFQSQREGCDLIHWDRFRIKVCVCGKSYLSRCCSGVSFNGATLNKAGIVFVCVS